MSLVCEFRYARSQSKKQQSYSRVLILSYLRVVSQGLCKMKLSPVFALRSNLDYVVVGLQNWPYHVVVNISRFGSQPKSNQLLLITHPTPPEIPSTFVDKFLSYPVDRQTNTQRQTYKELLVERSGRGSVVNKATWLHPANLGFTPADAHMSYWWGRKCSYLTWYARPRP